MKGPGYRIRHDVRRTWKCPQTGHTLRTSGSVTQVQSPFTKDKCWMKFVEPERPQRKQFSLDEILAHMVIAPAEEEQAEPAKKKKQPQDAKSDESAPEANASDEQKPEDESEA